MISLSTCWKSTTITNGEALLTAAERFEIDALELEYRISESTYQQMRPHLKTSRLAVVSIHNFFPFPADAPRGWHPSGDLFLLSHPDPDHRREAVRRTRRTIEHANDLAARAVVLHCGHVAMEPETGQLHGYARRGEMDTPAARDLLARKRTEREARKGPHVDALRRSLDHLVGPAERYGVQLGLENRFHYHELPGPEEYDLLLAEFNGAPVGYWHDAGHAHAAEILGWGTAASFLDRWGDHLIGVHLHDATGLDDHLPPGDGEIGFSGLAERLTPETLRVIELKPGTPDDAVARSVHFLRNSPVGP